MSVPVKAIKDTLVEVFDLHAYSIINIRMIYIKNAAQGDYPCKVIFCNLMIMKRLNGRLLNLNKICKILTSGGRKHLKQKAVFEDLVTFRV